MSIDEVKHIIQSSKDRGIHYGMIHYGGGEPTLWPHLKEATELFYNSGICNSITLISNGQNPDKIFEIQHMLDTYAISATQTTDEVCNLFRIKGKNVRFNTDKHRSLPQIPFEGVLPATCCNTFDYLGNRTNQLHYVNGKVYYCCWCLSLKYLTPMTDDLVCDFDDNFVLHFENKKYDKEICRYCICNGKVLVKILS
jgi:hypothetical protein